MIVSALLSIGVLMCVGVLLHLAWQLARAALVWAPSGYAGIVAGWYSVAFGAAAGVGAAALVRFTILSLWRRLFAPRRLAVVAWTEVS